MQGRNSTIAVAQISFANPLFSKTSLTFHSFLKILSRKKYRTNCMEYYWWFQIAFFFILSQLHKKVDKQVCTDNEEKVAPNVSNQRRYIVATNYFNCYIYCEVWYDIQIQAIFTILKLNEFLPSTKFDLDYKRCKVTIIRLKEIPI